MDSLCYRSVNTTAQSFGVFPGLAFHKVFGRNGSAEKQPIFKATWIGEIIEVPFRTGAERMAKQRAFISFDFEHDEDLRNLLAGQSLHNDTPFEIKDRS